MQLTFPNLFAKFQGDLHHIRNDTPDPAAMCGTCIFINSIAYICTTQLEKLIQLLKLFLTLHRSYQSLNFSFLYFSLRVYFFLLRTGCAALLRRNSCMRFTLSLRLIIVIIIIVAPCVKVVRVDDSGGRCSFLPTP